MNTPVRLTLLIAAALQMTGAHATCFVDKAATGSSTGHSWADAYKDLNVALNDNTCSEIWVAKGVYTPTTTSDQSISFNIHPNTSLYGGFAGTETTRDDRDPKKNRTILSGDIDSNDSNYHTTSIDDTTDDIVGNNSFHVVVLDGTTVRGPIRSDNVIVDGIVITGGDASGSSTFGSVGGGVLCIGNGSGNECSPTFRNVEFHGNNALVDGGALYGISGTGSIRPVIESSLFSGNSADKGGAISINLTSGSGTLRLTGDVFRNNRANSLGGAVAESGSDSSQLLIKNSRFESNEAQFSSGAVDYVGQQLVISGSVFQHNVSINGSVGALGYSPDKTPMSVIVSDTTFYANSAKSNAGAVLEYSNQRLESLYTNITFAENESGAMGGAMVFGGYHGGTVIPTLINTTFANNNAGTSGGALYGLTYDGGSFEANIFNATFSNNHANDGGAIFNDADGGIAAISVTNSIFWDNHATAANPEVGSSSVLPNISNSIVAGGCPASSRCSLVTSSDPLLSNLADHGGNMLTLLPSVGSPAIDAGDNSACPTSDQRGFDRSDGKCDIGATERQAVEDVIFKDGFAPLE